MPKRKEQNKPKAVNSEWEDKTSVLWPSNSTTEDVTVVVEKCISKLGLSEIHRSTEPDDHLDEQIKAYIHQRLELGEPGEARLEGLQSLVRQAREQVSQSKQYLHKTHDALEKKVEKLHTYTQAPQGWLVDLCSLHKEILLHLTPTFPTEDPCDEVMTAAKETLLLQLSVDELHVPPRLIVTEIRARKLDSDSTRDGESRPKAEKIGERVLTHSGAGGIKETQASSSEIGAVEDDVQLSSAKAEGNKKSSQSTKRVTGKGLKSSALNRVTTKESISPLATKLLANNKPGSSHADQITGSDLQSSSSKRVSGKESGSSSTKRATSMDSESQSQSVKRGTRREPHSSAMDEVVTNKPGSSDGDQFTRKKSSSSFKRITAGESVSMSTQRLTPVESQTSSMERVTTKELSSSCAFLKLCPCPKDSLVNGCSSPVVSVTEVASDAANEISYPGASSASVLVAPLHFTQDCLGHNKTHNARQYSTISLLQHLLDWSEETQNHKEEEKRLCHTTERLNIDLNSGHNKPSHEHPHTISSSINKPRTSKTHKDDLAASSDRMDMRVVRVSKEALLPESSEKRVSIQGHYLRGDGEEPLRFMVFLYRDERPDTEILTSKTVLCGTYVRDMLTTRKRLRWKFRHEF
ncbi:hypothetical protein V1264_012149 [Littorina saxatilis]|uniref:Uncharacterized protein n=1 Tax=Littorina saxatilis TaxID=31220 RepID=A0AAN9BX71_9CAEN